MFLWIKKIREKGKDHVLGTFYLSKMSMFAIGIHRNQEWKSQIKGLYTAESNQNYAGRSLRCIIYTGNFLPTTISSP